MGNCVAQKARPAGKVKHNTVQVQKKKENLCLEKQGVSTKYLLYKSIQGQDLQTTKKLRYFFTIDPNEEVSIKGYQWTALHYAAFFGASSHMEYFLKLAYLDHKDKLEDIINLQTAEEYTPLMIAAMNGRRNIVEVLLKAGGVKLEMKDKKGRTAKDLARSNGKSNCVQLLEEAEKKGVYTLAVNETFFQNAESVLKFTGDNQPLKQNAEDDEKYAELLVKGKRIPCAICQEDVGLIKYTNCCGQPLHGFCVDDKLKNCPYCKANGLSLINEIYYPERAFEL